ncbi:MAG: adenine deaminase [Spirochaetaceae bacterium]|nr:MAG: adenine deaminase [Spirochaetaceae bacterium]
MATVSDPHEIANVLGIEGVEYMLDQAARRREFTILFGAPPCVPATTFETAGAHLDAAAVRQLLERDDIGYLSEVMNVPGVLQGDPELMEKLLAAHETGKPIDGHAPGLRGDDVKRYAEAGVSTDHECTSIEEARDRLEAGMWVVIREGSAARDFEALAPLLFESPERLMFCSDDKHPNDLMRGHIDRLVARAVALGMDPVDALRVACFNPLQHYGLRTGLLRPGDLASFVVVEDLKEFQPRATWLHGVCVARDGEPLMDFLPPDTPNRFRTSVPDPGSLRLPLPENSAIRVIEVKDGSLITGELRASSRHCVDRGVFRSNTDRDLLKIVVINRYSDAPPAVAIVHGFGLKQGAIASSVAHDSHNIVAVGVDDRALLAAVESIISAGGGVAVAATESKVEILPLPIAGLMAIEPGRVVADRYERVDQAARNLGCPLGSPMMTLSFTALLVIPKLKLSDRGLFDGSSFSFTSLVMED